MKHVRNKVHISAHRLFIHVFYTHFYYTNYKTSLKILIFHLRYFNGVVIVQSERSILAELTRFDRKCQISVYLSRRMACIVKYHTAKK
jgi:hypothetical protein